MRQLLFPLLAWLALAPCSRAEDSGDKAQPAIAVIDFDYVDTSGEARDQRGEHEARLGAFMSALRRDLGRTGKFQVAAPACREGPCSLQGTIMPDLLAAARAAGADILLVGGIHKMSTLVQWAKVEAIDAKTGRTLFDRLFTFRGDTDEAWRRAEAFMAEQIAALPPS